MSVSPARKASFDILLRIETEGAFSSALLPKFESTLEPKDRSLCHEITLGTLRRQIYLDKIIDISVTQRKLDPEVRIALRIGLFQLLFLDKIPTFSAINESVDLVQRARKSSAKGLANAVLRRLSREQPALEYSDESERISIQSSHPKWLVNRWIAQLGAEDGGKLAFSNNRIPPLTFRSTLRSRENDLSAFGKPSGVVDGCFIAEGVTPELRAAVDKGEIYFQDEASQLVGNAVNISPGERFLDVCAAPGSKTTLVAKNLSGDPGMIVAGEFRPSRISYLVENCGRQGADLVDFCLYDATAAIPFPEESFDVVLADVPCSGTGTIRHNPEIRYTVDPDGFEALADKQLAILENASKVVRPGGRLLYSTCSLETEENELVCSRFLSRNSSFSPAVTRVPAKFLTADGYARTFPHRDNMDGFFIASFHRH